MPPAVPRRLVTLAAVASLLLSGCHSLPEQASRKWIEVRLTHPPLPSKAPPFGETYTVTANGVVAYTAQGGSQPSPTATQLTSSEMRNIRSIVGSDWFGREVHEVDAANATLDVWGRWGQRRRYVAPQRDQRAAPNQVLAVLRAAMARQ
jgi:hypothetical protein